LRVLDLVPIGDEEESPDKGAAQGGGDVVLWAGLPPLLAVRDRRVPSPVWRIESRPRDASLLITAEIDHVAAVLPPDRPVILRVAKRRPAVDTVNSRHVQETANAA
jgi:hypothetical protein